MTKKNLLIGGLGLLLVGLLIWGGPSPAAVAHGASDAMSGGPYQYQCPMMGGMMGYGPGMMGRMPMMGSAPEMGMMGGQGYGFGMPGMIGNMMGMGRMPMMGPGVMGGMGGMAGMAAMGPAFAPAGLTEPVTPEQAVWAVKGLPLVWSNPDLAVAKVLEFTNHFYILVAEKSTDAGALELLVDRYSGLVKSSPTTVWNARYGRSRTGQGMMGSGMMGRGQGQTSGPGMGMGMMGQMMGGQPQPQAQPQPQMAVSPEQAQELAQQLLARQLPGMGLGEAWAFPGYYTIVIKRDGRTFGLLSVNGVSGQVWLQSWHGGFIAERTLP